MQRRSSSGEASFNVNVSDIRKKLGQSTSVDIDIAFVGLKVIDTSVSENPITGTLLLESVDRGVVVTGSLKFGWDSNCRRCLEPISKEEEIFVSDDYLIDAPEDSESINFDGVNLDLGPVIRDSVLSSLPLVPLCDDSCQGPDPDRYPTLQPDDAEKKVLPDPRWGALDQLKFD